MGLVRLRIFGYQEKCKVMYYSSTHFKENLKITKGNLMLQYRLSIFKSLSNIDWRQQENYDFPVNV